MRTTSMIVRNIVEIDEASCDGCGLCVPSCEEGAIRIIGGKARVVSDTYCDGLGACLGHCPRGAISLVQRAAPEFDHEAVAKHLQRSAPAAQPAADRHACPGSRPLQLQVLATHDRPISPQPAPASAATGDNSSRLANWPVQLHLLSPQAYLHDADLLLVADCVPFALADFHARFLDGRPVAIGCPKLDDCQAYVQKLTQIIHTAQIRSITVVHMEVPCCTGLLRVAQAAVQSAGTRLEVHHVTVGVRGQILETVPAPCGH
jgi:Pyruvate/2-oxoacid:ferredoxin oxidoreductase delta subunit